MSGPLAPGVLALAPGRYRVTRGAGRLRFAGVQASVRQGECFDVLDAVRVHLVEGRVDVAPIGPVPPDAERVLRLACGRPAPGDMPGGMRAPLLDAAFAALRGAQGRLRTLEERFAQLAVLDRLLLDRTLPHALLRERCGVEAALAAQPAEHVLADFVLAVLEPVPGRADRCWLLVGDSAGSTGGASRHAAAAACVLWRRLTEQALHGAPGRTLIGRCRETLAQAAGDLAGVQLGSYFCTALVAVLAADDRGEGFDFAFASAGHPWPVLASRASRTRVRPGPPGPALGLRPVPAQAYGGAQVRLARLALALLTDGVSDRLSRAAVRAVLDTSGHDPGHAARTLLLKARASALAPEDRTALVVADRDRDASDRPRAGRDRASVPHCRPHEP